MAVTWKYCAYKWDFRTELEWIL